MGTNHIAISTHAPRTGSDAENFTRCKEEGNFNPRSPHGERLAWCAENAPSCVISTHAPRTGSDGYVLTSDFANIEHFNPRSPHGERRNYKAYASAE